MKDLEKDIRTYLKERSWDNLRPCDLAKSITIEAAELLELFQWDNQTLEEVKNDTEKLEEIKKELADVFIYALDMSVLLDLDTTQIIKDKLKKISKKYPEKLMRNEAGENNSNTYYNKIKKEYRQKGLS